MRKCYACWELDIMCLIGKLQTSISQEPIIVENSFLRQIEAQGSNFLFPIIKSLQRWILAKSKMTHMRIILDLTIVHIIDSRNMDPLDLIWLVLWRSFPHMEILRPWNGDSDAFRGRGGATVNPTSVHTINSRNINLFAKSSWRDHKTEGSQKILLGSEEAGRFFGLLGPPLKKFELRHCGVICLICKWQR